ncbi:two component transcriptional regulator, AraC family [Geobacter metallireducens RCH3]|uniref:Helix-turn-helix transcriptional response regulator, AraC family n=1 Tax=Geobacter metallireducens (strain ATCC 53774 / DSM 7210 / GS-15) TaxID=269799 RepID=Q39TN8_GEOMG|nr:AraC family transcriptional regulator [Geobacter metallireducens]ABB32386.1 helix-turn-helix transcriptional response regulator, AraC family [Geobacter metallireducens GS-15]EHP86724.1 two component transcriptional regulator, AraC family [Geobacter metallireducens RCH3]
MSLAQSIVVVAEPSHSDLYDLLAVGNAGIRLVSAAGLSTAIGPSDPDIVILDSGTDADGGITLLGEIKALRNDLPVIFLTDSSSEEIVLKAFRKGAREYFRKPVDLHVLQHAVETILALRRMQRERRDPLKRHYSDPINLPDDLPESIGRAVMHIKSNYDCALYLDDLARAAHLSKFHFCRNFKKYIGVSPMRFMNMVKISKAETLLRRADLTISTVAYKLGFNDPSEFTRQFKSITGISPSAFRRSCLS